MHLPKIKLAASITMALTMLSLPAAALPAPASTYTIAGGGAGGAVTVVNTGSPVPPLANENIVFTDAAGFVVTCTDVGSTPHTAFRSAGMGIVGSHAFAPATPPGVVTALDSALNLNPSATTFGNCTSSAGTATVTPSGTWRLGVSSLSGSTATGYFDFVALHVASSTCAFDLKGYIPGTFDNTSSTFTAGVGAGLTVTNVTGSSCALWHLANNQAVRTTGKFLVSPAITIS